MFASCYPKARARGSEQPWFKQRKRSILLPIFHLTVNPLGAIRGSMGGFFAAT
jgi:hypothetical protein